MRVIRTHADVVAVAPAGTEESLTLDFKANINRWNPPEVKPERVEQLEMCRDVAQFANAVGGVLLVGIADKEKRGEAKIAGSTVPVKDAAAMKGWIEQAIVNFLVPNTLDREVVVIPCPEGDVVAVNVPASRALVAVWDPQAKTIQYVKRSSHGKFYMNPDAAERHLMDGSRAARLGIEAALEKASNKEDATVIGGVWARVSGGALHSWKPKSVQIRINANDDWFVLRISTGQKMGTVHVPFGLVREAWVGADNRTNLILSARLVWDGEGEVTFEL